MALQSFEEDLLRRWFPPNAEETSAPFTENDIREIADVLTRCARERWSRVPRVYSILRKIGQLETIDAFIDSDITDVYFPFTKSTLPEALRDHSARLRFLELQHLVYNREALSLERHAPHGHFNDSTEVPFKKVGELGKGGFGYVDRVVSTISHKEYARKLILRGKTFKKDKQVLKDFTTELWNLKRLSHKHLVELVGSYTDRKFVAIVMLPVADANLQTFLERADLNENSRSFLRPFFGCLTSALCYLHDNRIRHKDIKPSNVLIKGDQVYFTDFGTALDWSSSGSSVTATAAPTTPRYCAPEVMAYTERSSSSDIWSLGCVFLEMWTVLKSRTLEDLGAHMIAHGSGVKAYHSNAKAVTMWIEVLRHSSGPPSDHIPSNWIVNMLQDKPTNRWNIHTLDDQIQEVSIDPSSEHAFKGLCCLEPDDDTTNETESFDECFEADARTQPLHTLERRDSGQLVGPASLEEHRLEETVEIEATSSADLSSLSQADASVPRILVNDCSVPPETFVKDRSDSLARELYDPLVPTRSTDDTEEAGPKTDDIMHSATDHTFSGSDDKTLQDDGTKQAQTPLSPTYVSMPPSITRFPGIGIYTKLQPTLYCPESGKMLYNPDPTQRFCDIFCNICNSQIANVKSDPVRLPCDHWIHRKCYAQGRVGRESGCPACILASREPAGQANRHLWGSYGRAQERKEAQNGLRNAGANKPSRDNPRGFSPIVPAAVTRPDDVELTYELPRIPYAQRHMLPEDHHLYKRTGRPIQNSDLDLMLQKYRAASERRSKKLESRSLSTDAKATVKSGRSIFTPLQTLFAEKFSKKQLQTEVEELRGRLPSRPMFHFVEID